MNFKDLKLRTSYISCGDDNIVSSLISPALKVSKLYQRSVAFFSSSVFKLLINSLPDFISNKGHIQLVISPTLSEADFKAIELGYKKKDELLNSQISADLDNSITELEDEELNILFQLVFNGTLDIKVACVKKTFGIYHDKLGIMTDLDDNKIVFYGSPNSSYNAYYNNYERIRVIYNWNGSNNQLVEDEQFEFDSLWNGSNKFLDVYEFKEAILKKIISEIEYRRNEKRENGISLYTYQREAIKKWVENGYKGFYVMATGTGKTWTAIYSVKELIKQHNCLIVILAPYKHLINQWKRDVEKIFPEAEIVLIYSDNSNWRSQATNACLERKYNGKTLIYLSTIASFYSSDFQKILSLDCGEKMLLVDEAHRFTRRDENVKKKFDYFLGLSATPSNGKNENSKDELLEYFGGQVYFLPIEFALERGFLVNYKYHPIYVYSTEEEEEQFRYWSKRIASCFDKSGSIKNSEKLQEALRNRLRIISMASEKSTKIDDILKRFINDKNFIVYCGDGKIYDDSSEGIKHVKFIKEKLDLIGVKSSQFTASEDASTRMSLIDAFNDNLIDALVAIRCLDEGVDIPSIKKALILSSNDNYREFVQRRGRILRKYEGKDIAHIYDIIVLPSKSTIGLAEIELRRFYEYARLAKNYESELKDELFKKLTYYGLTLDDIKFRDYEELEDALDE